jgi:hypothetical protein
MLCVASCKFWTGSPGAVFFLYFNELALEGTTNLDAGATLADGI